MSKQTEEFEIALSNGSGRFSEIIVFKVSGSDLYVFNKAYRGLYHISLHASGQLHVKIEGKDSLRHVGGDEAVDTGKIFDVERSKTQNSAVNPLNILIGTVGDWQPLQQTESTSYEKIPLPGPGRVSRISVFCSNTDNLDLFKTKFRSDQTILKSFSVHKGSFYALVQEEVEDPGIVKWVRASSTHVSTPSSLPVDDGWDENQYRLAIQPMTITQPYYILMLLVMNWRDELS